MEIGQDKIVQFCRHWKIEELAFFGSALREDFGVESDVDILVLFAADAEWGLLEHVQIMRQPMHQDETTLLDLAHAARLIESFLGGVKGGIPC